MGAKPERRKKVFQIRVDRERCKACYLCIDACPKDVFDKEDNFSSQGYRPVRCIRPENCIGCRACTIVCPDVCFELYEVLESA